MIAATYDCGCPAKLSSPICEPIRLQTSCSPCCFQSNGILHSQIQTAQRCTHSKKRPKYVYPTAEGKARCFNRKSFLHVPPYSQCCAADAFRMYSTPSRRLVSAVLSASKESMNKQFPRSRSESKSKDLEMSTEQTPTDVVVSEIVRKEQPFKEIEAIINDNRVIIRMHKEPVKEEYDPPCECIGQVASKESALSQRKCDDGVVFDMAHGNLELCRTPREDALSMKKTCEEAGCRTVTLYPNIKEDVRSGPTAYRMESREVKKSKMIRPIDLEENPNIFLLRIRKHCDSGDKRQTIDLEFRAPRPWLSRKKDLLEPETLKEYEDADKEYKNDTDKEYQDDTDKEYEDDIYKEYKDEEEHENEKSDAYEENDEWKI